MCLALLLLAIEFRVKFAVVIDHAFVRELLLGFDHDAGDLGIADFVGELVESEGLVDGPAKAFGGEVFEEETVAGILLDVEMAHGVLKSAGGVGDGEGSVSRSDHLWKTARLE